MHDSVQYMCDFLTFKTVQKHHFMQEAPNIY